MTRAVIVEKTRTYVLDNFLYARPDQVLGEHDALIGSGIIDSMGVMELLEFLKEEFGVEIADDEVTQDNLGNLSAIAKLLSSKLVLAA